MADTLAGTVFVEAAIGFVERPEQPEEHDCACRVHRITGKADQNGRHHPDRAL